jgi:hypothetical protein
MKNPAQTQTEEVAGGRRADSSQPRRATADLMPQLYSSGRPRPHSRASATRTTGAPQKGLPFAPLSARSRKPHCLVGTPSREPRISR